MKHQPMIKIAVTFTLVALFYLGGCGKRTLNSVEQKEGTRGGFASVVGSVIGTGGLTGLPTWVNGILILKAGPKEGPMQKPCGSQTGRNHPDFGSTQSCGGNNFIEIPLPTTGLKLSYNSLMYGNFSMGFGRKFSLSIDERYYSDGIQNVYYLMQGDGTMIPLRHSNDGEWSAADPRQGHIVFERHPSGREQQYANGDRGEFAVSPTDPNEYRLTKVTDRNGNTKTITRNENGHITQITNAYGASIMITYNGSLATSIRDLAGNFYQLAYDNRNRLTSVTYPDGRKWQFTYDSSANVTKSVSASGETLEYTYFPYALASIKNSLGFKTTYHYHKLGAVTTRTAFDSDEETFDLQGRVIGHKKNGMSVAYSRGSNGLVNSVTDGVGRVTTFAYTTAYGITDPRPTTITYPNGGGTKTFTYKIDSKAGRPTQVLYLKGNTKTVMNIDPWHGGVTSILKGLNGENATTYEYDAKGNLMKEIRNGRVMYTVTRDSRGRIITYTNDIGLTITLAYNSQGYVSTRTDPFGRVTTFETDALGNITRMVTPTMTYTQTYDVMGNAIGTSRALGNNSNSGEFTVDKSVSYHGNGARSTYSATSNVSGVPQSSLNATYSTEPNQILQRMLTDWSGQPYNLEQ